MGLESEERRETCLPSTQDNSASMSRPHVSLSSARRGGKKGAFVADISDVSFAFNHFAVRLSFLPTFERSSLMEFLHCRLGFPFAFSSPHLSQNHAGNVLNEVAATAAAGTASGGE